MSGLLESIARRRRASASRRLGPPTSSNGAGPSWNGAGPNVESAPVAEEAPAAAPEEAKVDTPEEAVYPADGVALATLMGDTSVAEVHDAPLVPAEEAPAASAEEAPATPAPEAAEVHAPDGEAPTAPDEEAPAAAPQAQPEPAEPPHPEPTLVESPPSEASPPSARTFVERGQIRRRARYLRRLREVQLRDIGGFAFELYRFGRDRPDLLQAKLQGAVGTQRELRALERALGEQQPLGELRQAGIGGACSNCGAVYGSADRYCAWCGHPVSRRA
jgi:hypothetical protein